MLFGSKAQPSMVEHEAASRLPLGSLVGGTLTERLSLVASGLLRVLFAKRYILYEAAGSVVGRVTMQDPDARAMVGVPVQFTYTPRYWWARSKGSPFLKRPIQSVAIGFAMPLHETVTALPGIALTGVMWRVARGGGVGTLYVPELVRSTLV